VNHLDQRIAKPGHRRKSVDESPVRALRLNGGVTPTQGQVRTAARAASRANAKLVEDLERLCSDAGISHRALADAAGVSHGYLSKVMACKVRPSLGTYAKLAVPLGADLSTRLYPNTGPLIRDRHQARITEALLGSHHPRWTPATEVGVRQPARGWIDVVLHEARERRLVAVEIESNIGRIEQQVRWARMKADSLPSWAGWPVDGAEISRLLIVRRTRANRQTALEFARQLAAAYPAHPEDAMGALTGSTPWPGAAMVWAQIDPDRVRFLASR
jgi:transcriptional regulator with XRE-family HTH domain